MIPCRIHTATEADPATKSYPPAQRRHSYFCRENKWLVPFSMAAMGTEAGGKNQNARGFRRCAVGLVNV